MFVTINGKMKETDKRRSPHDDAIVLLNKKCNKWKSSAWPTSSYVIIIIGSDGSAYIGVAHLSTATSTRHSDRD